MNFSQTRTRFFRLTIDIALFLVAVYFLIIGITLIIFFLPWPLHQWLSIVTNSTVLLASKSEPVTPHFPILISALIGGVIAAAVTAFFNNKINIRNSYINTVTAERVRWLGILRENTTDFVSQVFTCLSYKGKPDIDDELIKLKRASTLLRLRLNPVEKNTNKDLVIIKQIHEIFMIISNNASLTNDSTQEIWGKLEDFERNVSNMLKDEWTKVKDESENGRIL